MNLKRHVAERLAPTYIRASRALFVERNPASAAAVFTINIVEDSNGDAPTLINPTTLRFNPHTFPYAVEENVTVDESFNSHNEFRYFLNPEFSQHYEKMWASAAKSTTPPSIPTPDVSAMFTTGSIDLSTIQDDYTAYLTCTAIVQYLQANPTAENWNTAVNTLGVAIANAGHPDAALIILRAAAGISVSLHVGGPLSDDAVAVYGTLLQAMGKFGRYMKAPEGYIPKPEAPTPDDTPAVTPAVTDEQIAEAVKKSGYPHLADIFALICHDGNVSKDDLLKIASDHARMRKIHQMTVITAANTIEDAILEGSA